MRLHDFLNRLIPLAILGWLLYPINSPFAQPITQLTPCPYSSAQIQAGEQPFLITEVDTRLFAIPVRTLLQSGLAEITDHTPRPLYFVYLNREGRLMGFLKPSWAASKPWLWRDSRERPILSLDDHQIDPLSLHLLSDQRDIPLGRWPALITLPLSLVTQKELPAWGELDFYCSQPLELQPSHQNQVEPNSLGTFRIIALFSTTSSSLTLAEVRGQGLVVRKAPGGGWLYFVRWPTTGRLAVFHSPKKLNLRLKGDGLEDEQGIRFLPNGTGVDRKGKLHSLTPIPFQLAFPPPK